MKRENISKVTENINEKYIVEAENYNASAKKILSFKPFFVKAPVAACLIVCLILGIGFFGKNIFDKKPPVSIDDSTVFGEKDTIHDVPLSNIKSKIVLCSINDSLNITELQKNITLPLQYKISITNIKGFSQKEKEEAYNKEKLISDKELSKNNLKDNPIGVARAGILVRENAIIRDLRIGAFKIKTEHPSEIKSINVKNNSEYGTVEFELLSEKIPITERFIKGTNIDLDINKYEELFTTENIGDCFLINWRHSKRVIDDIDNNPDIDISSFYDTLNITIEYKDKTSETAEIMITFNTDGSASIRLNEYSQNV